MFKETKSLKALADQALNAQRMLGTKRLEAPSEDWDDNKWNEFYDHLRPKTVDDYSVPEKYEFGEGDKKSELVLDDESKGTLKELAHKLGLSQKQFQGLAEKYAETQFTGQAGIQESINEAVTKAIGSVKAEWGDTFDTNMKMAFEAYEAFSEEIPELKELMDWSPYVANHPAMLKLFHKLSGLTQDTGMFKGGMGGGMNDSSVGGIKAQISALETENANLLLHKNPSELPLSDRKRRDQLLETRTKLYEKLYG